ncbi:MAG: carboxylesterase family protein [Clostridiales bacterium]|nr:carboxylesterase family protein [Clostridiales bacterium]
MSNTLSLYQARWSFDSALDLYRLEGIVYCQNPDTPHLQCLNLYVPSAYMTESGEINRGAQMMNYTASTAPIVFENCIGGYSEAEPISIDHPRSQGMQYLRAGLVYVTVGARGKQTTKEGRFVGKAPIGLVDLKAAVRFLKHNRAYIAGDTERIISTGVSAGGAMSSLLGVTANNPSYDSYLVQSGAITSETDDVFAAQCYCPIIDLEHANMAYEWMFQGMYHAEGRPGIVQGGDFSPFQCALSDVLAKMYLTYFNSLCVLHPATASALSIDDGGRSGSGYDYLMEVMNAAITKHLVMLQSGLLPVNYTVDDYLDGAYTEMVPDSSAARPNMPPPMVQRKGNAKRAWLTWDGKSAAISSLDAFLQSELPRLKPCTSFDALDLTQAENQVFGRDAADYVHFDTHTFTALQVLADDYPKEFARYYDAFLADTSNDQLKHRIDLINPLTQIEFADSDHMAKHFRVRVGTHDPHTSFTMAMLLALTVKAKGCSTVDYAMVWDEDHGPADYKSEFVDWIQSIAT